LRSRVWVNEIIIFSNRDACVWYAFVCYLSTRRFIITEADKCMPRLMMPSATLAPSLKPSRLPMMPVMQRVPRVYMCQTRDGKNVVES
jgi:hypothetical protein